MRSETFGTPAVGTGTAPPVRGAPAGGARGANVGDGAAPTTTGGARAPPTMTGGAPPMVGGGVGAPPVAMGAPGMSAGAPAMGGYGAPPTWGGGEIGSRRCCHCYHCRCVTAVVFFIVNSDKYVKNVYIIGVMLRI